MGGEKLTFEPQLRFALNAEPWSFLFPVRYKVKSKGKFQLMTGIVPLMNFKNVTYTVGGVPTTDLVNRRYLGGELKPSFFITKNISAGAHYLYFHGISERTIQNTNFLSMSINFTQINLVWGFYSKFSSQFYYLNQDRKEGFYFNPTLSLAKKGIPISIQTIMNAAIDSNVPGSEDFIWNVSLVYSFNKIYTSK